MTIIAPPSEGVTTPPPVPKCLDCGELLGLYYAECPTCAHHASDYSLDEYAIALGDA